MSPLGKIVGWHDVRDYNLRLHEDWFYSAEVLLFTRTIKITCAGKWNASEGELEKASRYLRRGNLFIAGLNAPDLPGKRAAATCPGSEATLVCARAVVKRPDIYIFDDSPRPWTIRLTPNCVSTTQGSIKKAAVLIVAQRVGTITEC